MSEPNTVPDNTAPEWARNQITEANNEAAARRIEIRDLKAELDNVKGQLATANTEKVAAVTRAEGAESVALRTQIALDAGVPGDRVKSIAERLKGTTEAELKADAEALVKDFGISAAPNSVPATDHSQGQGGDSAATPNTPEAQFAQMWSNHFTNK